MGNGAPGSYSVKSAIDFKYSRHYESGMLRAFKFIMGQFIGWLFTTTQGAALLGVVWGAVMTTLAVLDSAFGNHPLLSYGAVFFVSFFGAIILGLLGGWIWTHISYRIGTKKPTYVEFKFENCRLSLTKKRNIYKEPHIELVIAQNGGVNVTIYQPPTPQNRKEARGQKSQKSIAQQPAQSTGPAVVHLKASAHIIVIFEKPILTSGMHLQLENIGGKMPTKDNQSCDERWASIALSDLEEDASFRIRFNDAPI